MTYTDFSDRLAVIGWPAREVARRLRLSQSRVRRWASGEYPVPADVADWIETIAGAIESTPVPGRPENAKPGVKPGTKDRAKHAHTGAARAIGVPAVAW
jgi:transcriptional regulator with XRE-family HTH domain